MANVREVKAHQAGVRDGSAAAEREAPCPMCGQEDVINRAWNATQVRNDLTTVEEQDEYFIGWTFGYTRRAEELEDARQRADARRPRVRPN